MQINQKITPFLSFNSEAEEAANFYVSILPDMKIVQTTNNPATGTVMTVEFELAGMRFIGMSNLLFTPNSKNRHEIEALEPRSNRGEASVSEPCDMGIK